MDKPADNQVRSQIAAWKCILVILALYVLQGVTLGIVDVMPLYLVSSGATWKQQGLLSFVMYPFTVKLLWAPLIDVLYIRQLGRRQTWLLPVQIMLGIMFISLSFYLESLLAQLRVTTLTMILFLIILCIATQDICVDGWALTLFSSSDLVWQSISQMIGQPLGAFLGSSILLTFESANMTNKLIRQPLGMTSKPYGLFTLAQFVRFWGVIFLITACTVVIIFRKHHEATTDIHGEHHDRVPLSLLETYLYVIRLFKKTNFHQLLFLIIGPHIGYAATSAMTYVVLVSGDVIKRETLGLITMPLILVRITTPLLLFRTDRPLVLFGYFYIPRLILCAVTAVFVLFIGRLQSYPILFYTLLIILLGLSDMLIYLQGSVRGAFFAQISDKRISSTYYTLLASLNNLGAFGSTSLVLYTANWLPKHQAYFIEVGICLLLGCAWLGMSWRLMYRLQELPVENWHLMLHKRQHHDDQE